MRDVYMSKSNMMREGTIVFDCISKWAVDDAIRSWLYTNVDKKTQFEKMMNEKNLQNKTGTYFIQSIKLQI